MSIGRLIGWLNLGSPTLESIVIKQIPTKRSEAVASIFLVLYLPYLIRSYFSLIQPRVGTNTANSI